MHVSAVAGQLSVAIGLLAATVAALELGFRAGRHGLTGETGGVGNQVGAIQGAVLGLLGLLLAFSFAAAGSRFMERQDLIVQEANAIGTTLLRADLLEGPQRSELRAALKEYTQHRVTMSANLSGVDDAVFADIERMHARIWRAARDAVTGRPDLAVVLLTPVNDVIDLHTTRVYAGRKHIPYLVLALLVACSLLAIGMIGYGCGMDDRRRRPLTWSLSLLVAVSLWITYDLDHPRQGLVKLNDAPLAELKFDP